MLPEDQIAGDVTEPIRQQKLSLALDKASAATLKEAADLHHKAHHELVTQKRATKKQPSSQIRKLR